VSVYSLVVGKDGPKFKETDHAADHPAGTNLPWGGVLAMSDSGMNLYGAAMASFASIVSSMARLDRPVQDHTGLTGRYDIAVKFIPQDGPTATEQQQPGAEASNPGSSAFSIMKGLGLELQSAKGQVETLVIDHIERPTEN